MPRGYFSMTLVWDHNCKFVFTEWQSQTITTFIIGCIVTGLMAFLAMAMPTIRSKIEKKLSINVQNAISGQAIHQLSQSSLDKRSQTIITKKQLLLKKWIIPIIYSLLYAFLHVMIMVIMMSMNSFVILAIIVGFTIGYGLFCDCCKLKTGKSCSGGCQPE